MKIKYNYNHYLYLERTVWDVGAEGGYFSSSQIPLRVLPEGPWPLATLLNHPLGGGVIYLAHE